MLIMNVYSYLSILFVDDLYCGVYFFICLSLLNFSLSDVSMSITKTYLPII